MARRALHAEHDRRVARVALALESESLDDHKVLRTMESLARFAPQPDVLETEIGDEPRCLESFHRLGHGVGWLHIDEPMPCIGASSRGIEAGRRWPPGPTGS